MTIRTIEDVRRSWIADQERMAADREFERFWLQPFAFTVVVCTAHELELHRRLVAPTSVAGLVEDTGVRANAIRCLLRQLSRMGLAQFRDDDQVALTELGRRVLAENGDTPEAVFSILHFYKVIRPFLPDFTEIARGKTDGLPLTWPPLDVEASGLFEPMMTATAPYVAAWIDERGDVSQARTLVDVGGGDGTIAACLCRQHEGLRADVVNLPVAQAAVEAVATQYGVTERLRFVGADFRSDPLPRGADVVLFSRVLSDWNDDVVLSLLQQSVRSLTSDGCVYVVEALADAPSRPDDEHPWTLFWEVLVPGFQLHGARSTSEWRALASKAGLTIADVTLCGRLPFSDLMFMTLRPLSK